MQKSKFETLTNFKKRFDRIFNRYLINKEKELAKIDPAILPVFTQIRKIALGGKRLRTFLAWLGYRGFGGKKDKEIIKIGIALELFQLFALIHDDIMDEDEKRRGVETIHHKFGISAGILAGDLVLSLAEEAMQFSIFRQAQDCPEQSRRTIFNYWNELKKEVMLGQYLDTSKNNETMGQWDNPSTTLRASESMRLKIYELKTARYTILRPLQMGAALAGASNEAIEQFNNYAINVGIAFQIKDDLLETKKTEINLVSLKGRKYCQNLLKELVAKAKKELENVKIRKPEKEILRDLTEYVISRKN